MKVLATIMIFLHCQNGNAQFPYDFTKISVQTQQYVSEIQKYSAISTGVPSFGEPLPAKPNACSNLKNHASNEELIELTNHPRAIVRCHAFHALSLRKDVNLLPIILTHINDTITVVNHSGCVQFNEKVGDYFISVGFPPAIDYKSLSILYPPSEFLDSVLIHTPNNLASKNRAILKIPPDEKYYERIRELVVVEKNAAGLQALAKYNKSQDVEMILEVGKALKDRTPLYKAIASFPHPAFFSFLQNEFEELDHSYIYKLEWRELYRAIASYKNDEALALLKSAFTIRGDPNFYKHHIELVFAVVQENYIPLYDELLWDSWEKANVMTLKPFLALYEKDSVRAIELTKKTVLDLRNFHPQLFLLNSFYKKDENLLANMLDILLIKDRKFAINAITKNLKETDLTKFSLLAEYAAKIKDPDFVQSLFDRLESEKNPNVYLKAAEVLFAYDDPLIKQQILKIYKNNYALSKGWGTEAFAKLLVEQGLKTGE